MRRARILILGGDHLKGVEAVREILHDNPSMKARQIDRLMQVIFDLQAVGRHKEAIALFGQLPIRPGDTRRQREILFWQADSWKAMRQYENAARYYLRSATLVQVNAMDPWAQTARYHAAEALLSAGLLDDAGAIFRQLLKVTKDKSRRTVLRNKLHQLTLQRSRRKQ
jgi:tetratricopeptide (TPR) repeat protein